MSEVNYHRAMAKRLDRFLLLVNPYSEWANRRMDEAWALYAGKLGLA